MAKAKNPGVGRGKGGGPKTEEGKARSSRNAIRHGVLAHNTIILPGEQQSDYEEMFSGWVNEFQPAGYAEERLVKLLIRNDWALQRAMRAHDEAEAAVFGQDPKEWSEEERAHLQNLQRYKTTAERSFLRFWNATQGLRKNRIWMDDKLDKMRRELREKELEIARLERVAREAGLEVGPRAESAGVEERRGEAEKTEAASLSLRPPDDQRPRRVAGVQSRPERPARAEGPPHCCPVVLVNHDPPHG